RSLAILLAVLGAAHVVAALPPPIRIDFIGESSLAAGLVFDGSVVGGLSALDYDPASGRYAAIADRAPQGASRFYGLDIGAGPTGFTRAAPITMMRLRQPDGQPFDGMDVDPEGLRRSAQGSWFWSSEGVADVGIAPFVREMADDGSFVRDFDVPAKYRPAPGRGVRMNLGFESLTLTHDKRTLFAATENALAQDGPVASLAAGSPARILRLDVATGKATGEFVYLTDRVAAAAAEPGGLAVNGLTELLALSDTQFVALERSFSAGVGHAIKLYLVDLDGATDVHAADSLAGLSYRAATKTLLLDLGTLGIPLYNLEGLTFGPPLADGRRTLIVLGDNNYTPGEASQLLLFAVR
ncbi:MAG: esterase-like activity of phytase family protein, partial [Polymorphobacter sp.]